MAKILVIEDDLTIRTALLKMLSAENYEVIAAPEGQTGLSLAQRHRPDLILCDIMMPGCDGYEVLTQLQQNPATASIPFIFLTAKADRQDIRRGMAMGADDYLTKPFTRQELMEAIATRLSKHASITQPYIQEMKQAVDRLNQIAYRDPTTQLANCILFHHHLQEHLESADGPVALLLLRLNASMPDGTPLDGAMTEDLAAATADRLREAISPEEAIARLNSNTFGVFQAVAHRDDAVTLAQTLLSSLNEPCLIDNDSLQPQLCAGIALAPENGTTASEVIANARQCLQAIYQKPNCFQFHSQEVATQSVQRTWVLQHIGRAIERDELRLLYQPQVNLISGRIIGAEALIRWQHPDAGTIYPAQFLPILEETDWIVKIGEWVLKTACANAARWKEAGHPGMKLSINLSARQFRKLDLPKAIAQATSQTGFDPHLLVLDITEATLHENRGVDGKTMQQLQQLGVQLALDDFGTGYSSLYHLRQLPLDCVKIDRTLVADLGEDEDALSIAKAIVAIAQSLQTRAIAGGVETDTQLRLLRQIGCYAAQGNRFEPPLSARDLQQLLQTNPRL
ncbi:EAL domain-containing protein [Thermoleptolyngbya sichuanensis XZ-Cy5]|uniref:two-component system response regulator n=1 Tax=Thermoleptolyngbya sichuanensis TaxID=2885951 RepID=UPI00240D237D|nr:EAL domain-containing protein [Thermoleptolyngbya sichuanensis]MDG2617376.1 EAL domain-containing protein [Thermoleptolyngbya sichuanensis XZ-Cy5]